MDTDSIQVAPVIRKIWLVCPEVDVFELELNDKVIYKTTCVGAGSLRPSSRREQ